MNILVIFSGEYGRRHFENIQAHSQPGWNLISWQAPAILPPVIDYPEDYLPASFAPADLILSFAEHRGVAELIPDIAGMTGASGVVAAIDNEAWLPRGLARQLRGWLERMNVACATPKPLCSLTEFDYGVTRRQRIRYESAVIAEFAQYFGQPSFDIQVDPVTRTIISASVKRDAFCGCARYVAEHLVGVPVDDAAEKGGLLHHHYPCLAAMGIDSDFNDTLMHISGNVFKDDITDQIRPYLQVNYLRPGNTNE